MAARRGIEIGAGRFPTELFGDAAAINADIDSGDLFGTDAVKHRLSIDDPVPAALQGRFDFVIASHVLEHADGIIRAVENLLDLSRPDGTIYIVVPDIRFLIDAAWMPYFDLAHHADEYRNPGKYNAMHDQIVLAHMRSQIATASPGHMVSGGQVRGDDILRLVEEGEGGANRFMSHKHTMIRMAGSGSSSIFSAFCPSAFRSSKRDMAWNGPTVTSSCARSGSSPRPIRLRRGRPGYVDQAGAAQPRSNEEPGGSFERTDRHQGLGVADLDIVDRPEPRLAERRPCRTQQLREAGDAGSRRGSGFGQDLWQDAGALPLIRTEIKIARRQRQAVGIAHGRHPTISTQRSRSRASRVTTCSC